jgi:hypothetical protein
MVSKTIILERRIGNRIHRAKIRGRVYMHVDLMDKLVSRCVKFGVKNLDIEELFNMIVDKK